MSPRILFPIVAGNPSLAFTTGSYKVERIRERIAHEPPSRTPRREESCLLPEERVITKHVKRKNCARFSLHPHVPG